jgi:hypothetical protein
VVIGGILAAGLTLQAAMDPPEPAPDPDLTVTAGVAIPAAAPAGALTSTWYCAAGTASGDSGLADHVIILANSSKEARTAIVTPVTGTFAPKVEEADPATSTTASTSSTTTSTTVATTTTSVPPPEATTIEVPALGRASVSLSELVKAPVAGAIVEIDGGSVAVDHQVTGEGGRATAPCSTTAATEWSFPWGVTSRGNQELLFFMNPFPDDATVDVEFTTDEGTRDTLRFRGFVVPARSVVAASIGDDVTRKEQVSAQVHVRSGRLVVDRIQTFDGTDGREGLTLGLGQPTPAPLWVFPDGKVGDGISEQIVVFNPTEDVAEAEIELRLDDPAKHEVPEPFELTISPKGYQIVTLEDEDRVPKDVAFHTLVRSANGVPLTAERVISLFDPSSTLGVSATSGTPVGAPTWIFPGGGTSDERDEWITLVNASNEDAVTFDVLGLEGGQTRALQDLQDVTLAPGTRLAIQISDHVKEDDLPLLIEASGPIYAERGLFRVGGRGLSQSMGIPLAQDVLLPDPLNA